MELSTAIVPPCYSQTIDEARPVLSPIPLCREARLKDSLLRANLRAASAVDHREPYGLGAGPIFRRAISPVTVPNSSPLSRSRRQDQVATPRGQVAIFTSTARGGASTGLGALAQIASNCRDCFQGL